MSHHHFGNLVLLLGMSVHVGSRSVFYVEYFSRKFLELHHVDGLEVIIGLILLKRLKAREGPFGTESLTLRSLSELLDIVVQLLIIG
jgi:hypothetical protein